MTKNKTKSGRVKYRGIVQDAARLGVNRATLWRVLKGHWKSKSLMRRYRDLKRNS